MPESLPTMLAAAQHMDGIDWVVFVAAVILIPLSVWWNIRWWRKSRRSELPRDWQSFVLIVLGLVCMIAIVCWYYFRFIRDGRY